MEAEAHGGWKRGKNERASERDRAQPRQLRTTTSKFSVEKQDSSGGDRNLGGKFSLYQREEKIVIVSIS